jgi:hypothetical protein
MDRRGAGLSSTQALGRALRCAAVALLVAVGGVIAASPSQAGPMAPAGDAFSAHKLEMVRDYCGHGYHRPNKQRTKWGAWVGKCVPNKPKKQRPASQPANPPG